MNFDRYPLDVQHCPFQITSYSDNNETVTCTSTLEYSEKDKRSLQHYIRIEQFSPHTSSFGDTLCGFNILLSRTRMQNLIQVYLISTIFVIVSWVSFIIQPDVVPGRMGLLITTFLVLINIFNSVKSGAPTSTNLNAVDLYLVICIGLVFAALAEYAMILYWKRNHGMHRTLKMFNICRKNAPNTYQISSQMQHDNSFATLQTDKSPEDYGQSNADSASLIIFPVVFILLNTVYWSIYL